MHGATPRPRVAEPAATLGAGVTAGFIAGVVIGGIGGRLAMLALRVTSDPSLRGTLTDDSFVIGRVSSETLFLLGVTSGLGILGGLLYLIVRGWIAPRWRIASMTVFFGLVGGAGVIRPDGRDFTLLEPLSLAVGLFVVIAAAYGAAMPWLTERFLREDSVLRRTRWGWIAGLLPLVLVNIVGVVVLLVAGGVWAVREAAPGSVTLWRSRSVTLVGRIALTTAAILAGVQLVDKSAEILG